jgi:hypothetical protein
LLLFNETTKILLAKYSTTRLSNDLQKKKCHIFVWDYVIMPRNINEKSLINKEIKFSSHSEGIGFKVIYDNGLLIHG